MTTTVPCRCCGKEIKTNQLSLVATHHGIRFMSHEAFVSAFGDVDPASETPRSRDGMEWWCCFYGSGCYAKLKRNNPEYTEVVGSDGLRYLFIDSPDKIPAPTSRKRAKRF